MVNYRFLTSLHLKFLATAALLVSVLNIYAENTVPASDPNIQVMGRVDMSNSKNFVFSYPGVSITAKFRGTAIKAILNEYGGGETATTNYFNIIVDGGEPTLLKLSPSDTLYTLAEGLSDGLHTVTLFKRTESIVGKVGFRGYVLNDGSSLVAPDPLPNRKMLFIGNSMTCGYGNEISTTDPDSYHFTSVNENNYNAWGAVSARKFNAQYHCVAYSGQGLYQNNNGTKDILAPHFFNRIFPDDSASSWDHHSYVPDVVVVNLGTNDFYAETSKGADYYVTEEKFVGAYVDFIKDIKSHYPLATLICAVGNMMTDGYPSGAQQWTRIQNYVAKAVDSVNGDSGNDIHTLALRPQSSPYGEDWHPTVATQQKMSDQLVAKLESIYSGRCPEQTGLGRDFSTMGKDFPIILGTEPATTDAYTYQWFKDGTLLPNETGSSMELDSEGEYAGTYTVIMDSAFCTFTDDVYVTSEYLEKGSIQNWAGGKDAAVVLTFDDWSNGHPNIAVPQMKKRGMVGTFNIVSGFVNDWSGIQTAADNGNEIANHSNSHADISKMNAEDYSTEISDPHTIIESNLTGVSLSSFAYPFGTFNSQIIDTLQAMEYVGARGVWPSSNNYSYDFATSENDYFNILTYPIEEATTASEFGGQIRNVIRGGGVLTYLYHSINSATVIDDNYSAVTEGKFMKQLDTLLSYQSDIWLTTFSNALKYHKEKRCATLMELEEPTDSLWVLKLTDTLSNDSLYNYPLSIVLPLEGFGYDMVIQNGKPLLIEKVENEAIQFNAVPDAGLIKLIKTGMSSSMELAPHEFLNAQETEISVTVNLTEGVHPVENAIADFSALGGGTVTMAADGESYSASYIVPEAFPQGEYAVRCFFTDTAANVHSVYSDVKVDNGIDISQIILNNGQKLYTNIDTVSISVEASCVAGIHRVVMDLTALGGDSETELDEAALNTYVYKLPVSNLTPRATYVSLVVYDAVGNTQSATKTIMLYKPEEPDTVAVNQNQNKQVSVWPNPTSGMLSIACPEDDCEVVVFDHNAKVVLDELVPGKIDLGGQSSGCYWLIVRYGENYEVMSIIKQ